MSHSNQAYMLPTNSQPVNAPHAHPNLRAGSGGVTIDRVGSQRDLDGGRAPFINLSSGNGNTSTRSGPTIVVPPPQSWDKALRKRKSFVQQVAGIMTVGSSSKNDHHYLVPAPPLPAAPTDEWHAQLGVKFGSYGKPTRSDKVPFGVTIAHQISFETDSSHTKRLPGVAFSELMLGRGVKHGERMVAEEYGITVETLRVVFTWPHLPAFEADVDIRNDERRTMRTKLSLGRHIAHHFQNFISQSHNYPVPADAPRLGSAEACLQFNNFRLVNITEGSDGKWAVEVAWAFR